MLNEIEKRLRAATDLLGKMSCDLIEYGSEGNEYKITISGSYRIGAGGFSYGIPDDLAAAMRRGLVGYISELEEEIRAGYYRDRTRRDAIDRMKANERREKDGQG